MADKNPFKISPTESSNFSLNGKYRNSWVEEALDVEVSEKLAVSHTKNYLGTSIEQKRLVLFFSILLLGLLIILGRVFYLQIASGDYYYSLAENNRIRLQPIPAERGVVYDRNGHQLIHNVPGFSLVLSPQDLPRVEVERQEVIKQVALMSSVPEEEIRRLLTKYGGFSEAIIIKENLEYNTALQLYIQNASLPGIRVESGSERFYSLSPTSTSKTLFSLSHVLGYMGKLTDTELNNLREKGYLLSDKIGRTGIEKTYEQYLRGTYGRKKVEVNALGREQDVLAVSPPVPGKNVILTIDSEAQRVLEDLVSKTAEKIHQRKISVVAMHPDTGEIIAMVSWPGFDNNKFAHGIDQKSYQEYLDDKDLPLFNRTIGGGYPPGSTAKLMVAAAALQEKIATRNTSVSSVGGITVGGILFKDWIAGGHGTTNVTKALAWSVNTYFYYVGGGYEKFTGLGVDRITEYMRYFHVGQKTNIDLPGENPGFIPSKEWKKKEKNEPWYVGDTYNLSIGQGDLLVTPMHVALWTAAVANNGTVVTPHLGKAVVDPIKKSTTTLQFEHSPLEAVSPENLGLVREGMRDCVTIGSCKLLQTLPFQSGGKTGTAQWNKNRPTHAWFTSFAPYTNPQIVVTVLVEEGGQGSTVSMPIARDFLAWWGKRYLP